MDKLDGLSFYKECEYREMVCALWLNIALRGVSIGEFFINNDLRRVVIYGYGKIGKMLHYELDRTEGVDVVAVIDKNHSNLHASIPIIGPDDTIPQNDIVLVTVSEYYLIKRSLQEKCQRIISFKEFLEGYGFEIIGAQ